MIALITGAAGGLGRVLAAECARRGYSLFLTDVDSHGLEAVRQGLARQFGVEVRVHARNLADAADLEAMLAVIDAAKMRFDMLFNVAGMDLEGGFMRLSREEAVEILQANVSSALRITHALLKRSSRPFYLVFVSSLAAMFPMLLKATYAASKRFLLDFSLALRCELRHEGVRVLALCPGGMPTNPEAVRAMLAQGLWGRVAACPLEAVARKTLDLALRGRAVYIPGAAGKALCMLGRLLPRRCAAAAIGRRWSSAQGKWLCASRRL